MNKKLVLTIIPLLFIIIQITSGQKGSVKTNNTDISGEREWIPLFNGKNLDGWIPKVTGYKSGENPLNGILVDNGILRIDYSKFAAFNGRFSHLFYKEKLSGYILHVEYRFIGEVLPDAPSYCFRNSGVMIHSQSPESMEITQNWPVSVEVQLLGSTAKRKQLTANVCTPGTTVNYKGVLSNQHCINSASKYYYDGEWVNLDIIVHGGGDIYHVIDGDTVLAYNQPRIGGNLKTENYPVPDGTLLEDGYIALQGEGQPIEFRRVDLKYLDKAISGNSRLKSGDKAKNSAKTTESTSLVKVPPVIRVIDNFDSYISGEQLLKTWYLPVNSGTLNMSLEPAIKASGKYSMKCEYTIGKTDQKFPAQARKTGNWDLTGCNGVRFWFKPDGSGRELKFEFNTGKEGGNMQDLWGYVYKTEKGDTNPRLVTVPFNVLVHDTRLTDSQDKSSKFKPESITEVLLYIGSGNSEPGNGTFYIDDVAGCKLQI